jgi:hypothetical protein
MTNLECLVMKLFILKRFVEDLLKIIEKLKCLKILLKTILNYTCIQKMLVRRNKPNNSKMITTDETLRQTINVGTKTI